MSKWILNKIKLNTSEIREKKISIIETRITISEKRGIIIMGNEANGISQEIEKFITKPLTIPRFGNLQQTESLNVANATAIILSEFKRNS